MAVGKAVNLRVRPFQSVDLSFPVAGIVGFLPNTLLGQTVKSFGMDSMYMTLSMMDPNDVSRLVWDSTKIWSSLGLNGFVLAALRAEPLKADLDNAISFRQNAFLTTYSSDIINKVREVFYDNPSDQSAVLWRLLADLQTDSVNLNKKLTESYKNAGIWGNIVQKALNFSKQTSGGQTILTEGTSQGYEFRHPSAENDMRYRRTRASLGPEFLNAWRMAHMCLHGDKTFKNELAAIDRQVKKLQIAYLDTLLTCEFEGVVTGVFSSTGEYVNAGQPILRVEDDTFVYLVGTVKHRGLLRVNSKVKVTTTLFDAPGGGATTIEGSVAAVRGHNSVDEQWDVLIKCSNRTNGGTAILPLNYNFDFESTTIDVVSL